MKFGPVLAIALALSVQTASAQPKPGPNQVEISPTLVTSGQPPSDYLASLGAKGYGAVIYLAPPTVSDAVREETLIVGGQGIVFVNIPINFSIPTDKDFQTFAAVLSGLSNRKVLVHCQVNMRASAMVFLYRVIVAKEDPKLAYEAVAKVWAPQGAWKKFIVDELREHQIAFEPY